MKGICKIFISLCLLCAMPLQALAAVETNASNWAKPAMIMAYEEGLVPEAFLQEALTPMSRADFCTIAIRFYNEIKGEAYVAKGQSPFTDCADASVIAAYELGIVSGVSETEFAPDNTLTREQMAIIMVRTLKACEVDLSATEKDAGFQDTYGTSEGVRGYINQLHGAGLISGNGSGNFNGKNKLTTQEGVSMFLRAYQYCMEIADEIAGSVVETPPVQSDEKTEPTAPVDASLPKEEAEVDTSVNKTLGGETTVSFGDKAVAIGQTKEEVEAIWGEPNRVDETMYGIERLVYLNEYKQYFFATLQNNTVVEIFTPTRAFAYQGVAGSGDISDIKTMDRFSTVDHSAIIEGETVHAKILLDYAGEIAGLLLQESTFAQTDYLKSGLSNTQKESYEAEILDLLQVKRIENGMDLIVINTKLSQVARNHSNDMAKKNYLAYTNQDKLTAFDRIRQAKMSFETAGEVISRQRGDVVQTYLSWIRTAAKIESLTNSSMTSVGIGASAQTKEVFVTVDLCGGLKELS